MLQTHVDDVEYLGLERAVNESSQPGMEKEFKVSVRARPRPGDEMDFLKRRHVLNADGSLLILPHPEHIAKLTELLHIGPHQAVKKCPLMPGYTDEDVPSLLEPTQAVVYRTCIGILLYLASDLIESQNAVRYLSQKMASPTVRGHKTLCHLVSYLNGAASSGVLLTPEAPTKGSAGAGFNAPWVVEAYPDSDWASDKQYRKSISSGVIALQGNLLRSSSQTQRCIALSSAKAELRASSGVLCDCMLSRGVIQFLLERHVPTILFMDSSSGRQIWQCTGCGQIRHLSCRVLWVQKAASEGLVEIRRVSGIMNSADLNTKLLTSCDSMRFLMYFLKIFDAARNERVGQTEQEKSLAAGEHKACVSTNQTP